MDTDIIAIKLKLEQQTFAEKCEHFLSDRVLRNNYSSQHLIIFEIDKEDRKEIFKSELHKTKYIGFNDEQTLESEYDYRYIDDFKYTPKKLFNLLNSHNDKIIIFESDSILAKQAFINILQGAICSSPDSGSKWSVYLDSEKKFIFTGTIILLSTLSKEKFITSKKYFYLNRDLRKK